LTYLDLILDYTLFLYNDHEQAKTLINAALSTLAFTPARATAR
jgi:hypothetical protein